MARVYTGQAKRDLSAAAAEISELKRELGVGDQPSNMLQGVADGETDDGSEGSPAMRYGSIMVAVRKRPRIPNREEDQNDILKCGEANDLTVYAPKVKVDLTPVIEPTSFVFDYVFSEKHNNTDVYEQTTRPLLQTVREGGSAVVFAFGQTGSGKTYTMMGYPGQDHGIYSLAVEEVFEMLGSKVRISASFYEIYGVKCFDLLNDRNEVKVMQDEYKNVHVVGIVERKVENQDDILSLMQAGSELRSSGQTHANDRSSRSHAVLVINLKTKVQGALYSRMTFVDLAGSERASDTTNTDKKTQREGAEINKSLLALKECIRAMGMRKRHIPFRGSKLTQILRESFIGNCSTCVIANVSPCQSHCEDTLNTLRYADRIKELKADGNGADLAGPAIPCANCGAPIFVGDRHVCRRVVVQCQYCRESMDKDKLEDHLTVCKDAPAPCPHCLARVVQGDVAKHQKKCLKIPIKCPMCESMVPRETLPKHQKDLCPFARVPCRHCRGLFPRGELDDHEDSCIYQQVVCPHCLMPMKKMKIESHMSECTSNKGVRAVPQTARGEAPSNAHAERYQRSPSVGVPARKPSMVKPIVQGAHGIAQLSKQNKGDSPNSEDSEKRPYTMSGPLASTDPKLPRLSALEKGNAHGGEGRTTIPAPVAMGNNKAPSSTRTPSNHPTPRGNQGAGIADNGRKAVSAHGSAGIVPPLGRIGGGDLTAPYSNGNSPARAYAPSPPKVGSPDKGSSNQGITSSGSGSFGSNGSVDCQYCKRRVGGPAQMEAHLNSDCQFAPVNCAFSKYGCNVMLHRLHITKHMAESMSRHLELVIEYAEDVSRENDELRYLLATQSPGQGNSRAGSRTGSPRSAGESQSDAADVELIIRNAQQSAATRSSSQPPPQRRGSDGLRMADRTVAGNYTVEGIIGTKERLDASLSRT